MGEVCLKPDIEEICFKLNTEININITQDDINQGKRGNCSHCPISLAFQRIISSKYKVETTIGRVIIENVDKNEIEQISLNKFCSRFIRAFDRNLDKKIIVPFEFEIDIPIKFLPQFQEKSK